MTEIEIILGKCRTEEEKKALAYLLDGGFVFLTSEEYAEE